MFPVLSEYYVKRTSMPEFLNRLDENPGSVSLSAYFPPGLTEDDVRKMALPVLPERIIGEIVGSVVGAAVFTGNEQSYFVLPPFPLKEKVVFTGCITEPLCEMITRDFHIGLVLVHLGTYAVGVCRGDILVSSKVGTGLVHGRTRKGGSSSQRFQRRRENQAREFLERVCGHAREHLGPYEKTLDYLVCGGPHQTVLQLQKECPFLKSFDDRALPLMEVPAIRRKVLEAAVSRIWSSKIIEWGND